MDKLKEMLRNLNLGESVKKIEVQAYTLEKAISEGCKRLNASLDEVEYEVIEYGQKGFLGINKKPFKILIYKIKKPSQQEFEEEFKIETGEFVEEAILDPDGKFYIILSREGVLLKVTPPKASQGRKVKLREVLNELQSKGIKNFDEKKIKKAVELADGNYISIGSYDGIEEASAKVQIKLAPDEMKATAIYFPPKAKGFELTKQEVIDVLSSKGIIKGILEKEIEKMVDEKIYYKELVIAQGKKPVDGEDAQFKFYFDIEHSRKIAQELLKVEKFDFKKITKYVQNVLKGDLLVEKIPPGEGEDGFTVTGKILRAKPGKDKRIPAGENTVLSEDGLQLRAAVDGHVVRKRGRICVEPVKHIQGNLDIKVGNIVFVGSVVIHGSVMDGFSVKAKGNIEVRGSVGKAELISDSDIYIAQGVAGKHGAVIKAEGNIFAKFIENAKVYAKRSIVIDAHILHSEVEANEYIVCFGRRAQIAGGIVRAGYEVNTRNLGAVSYTDTIVETGIFPELRRELEELELKEKNIKEEISDLKRDITTLEIYKKQKKHWNDEREEMLQNKIERLKELEEAYPNIVERLSEINEEIIKLDIDGKVCVRQVVYPGTYIKIKTAELKISNEMRTATFYEKEGMVRLAPYEPPKLDKRYYDKRILSLRGKL